MATMRNKYTKQELDKQIQAVREEYEAITKEQKDRILALREEKNQLAEQLETYAKNRDLIASALLQAERAAEETIAHAKAKASAILEDAEKNRRKAVQNMEYYNALLEDLGVRCENILDCIQKELAPSMPGKGLGLVVGNRP